MAATTNPYERVGRINKARRLVAAIAKLPAHPTAAEVEAWPTSTWEHLAAFASALATQAEGAPVTVAPPSEKTRWLVLGLLRSANVESYL